MAAIREHVIENELDTFTVTYVAAVKILLALKELKIGKFFDIDSYKFKRNSVKNVITEWFAVIKKQVNVKALFRLIEPSGDDYLGLLYQSIFKEGQKSEQGFLLHTNKIGKRFLCWAKKRGYIFEPLLRHR